MPVTSAMVPLGTPAPDFDLPSVRGGRVRKADLSPTPALLVAFLSNHCPFVQHIEKELGRLAARYPGMEAVAVCSNATDVAPDDGADGLRGQLDRAGWAFPYLVDAEQEVARRYGAVCTPDLFLFDADGLLAYRGAFDESTPGNGRPVTGELLAAAVEAVIAGRPVPEPHLPSTGCSIKWSPAEEESR